MLAKRLAVRSEALLDPGYDAWGRLPAETLELGATPLRGQASRYVRTAWADRPYGAVHAVIVRAAHNEERLFFRLEWLDDHRDVDFRDAKFPDGAAVLFPLDGTAPLDTMGSASQPVGAWYWRADLKGAAQELVATGPGTIDHAGRSLVTAQAEWADGAWRVVLSRPLDPGDDAAGKVRLAPDGATQVAFAVWAGSNQERAGLKAYSKRWSDLRLEA